MLTNIVLYIERKTDGEIRAPSCRQIDMREASEAVNSRYFCFEEEAVKLPRQQADKVMRWWIKKLDKITGAVRSVGIANWRKELEEKHADKEDGGSAVGLMENEVTVFFFDPKLKKEKKIWPRMMKGQEARI